MTPLSGLLPTGLCRFHGGPRTCPSFPTVTCAHPLPSTPPPCPVPIGGTSRPHGPGTVPGCPARGPGALGWGTPLLSSATYTCPRPRSSWACPTPSPTQHPLLPACFSLSTSAWESAQLLVRTVREAEVAGPRGPWQRGGLQAGGAADRPVLGARASCASVSLSSKHQLEERPSAPGVLLTRAQGRECFTGGHAAFCQQVGLDSALCAGGTWAPGLAGHGPQSPRALVARSPHGEQSCPHRGLSCPTAPRWESLNLLQFSLCYQGLIWPCVPPRGQGLSPGSTAPPPCWAQCHGLPTGCPGPVRQEAKAFCQHCPPARPQPCPPTLHPRRQVWHPLES